MVLLYMCFTVVPFVLPVFLIAVWSSFFVFTDGPTRETEASA